ncbi:MAG: exopolysaccharide biosynthesis protein [Gammaproteobacteria bacterium]|nr:exopolysaccharide biosynthesis protein [Gammaproteobacteria bacterium]
MSLQFKDSERSLSAALRSVRDSIQGEYITLGQLLELVGEQGLLLFVMLLMVPFLLPVSIPGVSTLFSTVVIFVGLGVVLNRIPWFPVRLLESKITTASLLPALDKGDALMQRIDRIIQPRFLALSQSAASNRLHGVMLIVAGVLLLFPLGFVPFSNTFPGLAVLLLAAGIAQRDGIFIVLGYAMIVVTIVYFSVLALAATAVGENLINLGAIQALIN